MKRSIIHQCEYTYVNGEINLCGSDWTILYILSFNVVVSIVFMNLFVAIILQNFSDLNAQENQLLNENNMEHLRQCWARYDEEGTGFMPISKFIEFLCFLDEPLGFTKI